MSQPPPESWGTPPPPLPAPERPQPGWAPPPTGASPVLRPSRPSRVPWLLAGAAVLALLMGIGLWLALRGSSSDPAGPEAAAEQFVAAAKSGDCTTFNSVTSPHFQDTYFRCQGDVDTASLLGPSGVSVADSASVTDRSDDTAVAEVRVSAGGFSLPVQLRLVRSGTAWLVDDLTIAGLSPGELANLGPGDLPS